MLRVVWCFQLARLVVVEPIRSSGHQGHDLRGATFNDRRDVVGPKCQRRGLFTIISAAVVDTGYAGLGAAYVVEHRLDRMRRDTKLAHARCARASEIMRNPRWQGLASRSENTRF